MDIGVLLTYHTLYIDSEYQKIASLFCNLEGYKKQKSKEKFLMKTWFDGYIYTALIGLIVNRRKKFTRKIEKSRNWSTSYIEQYKYIIGNILARKDILNELNILDYKEISQDTSINLEDLLLMIKNICDEFSIGGLDYLRELYEKDNSIFDDFDSLKNIMDTAIQEKEKQ